MIEKIKLEIDGKPCLNLNVEKNFEQNKYAVPGANNKLLGFSTEKALLEWADKKGKRKVYENCLKSTEKARKDREQLSEKEINDYEKTVNVKIKALTAQFKTVLKKEGVTKSQAAKILKLSKEGKIGTGYLYQNTRYRGNVLTVPTGTFIGRLSEYGFDDITTSVINASNQYLILHKSTWYRGLQFIVDPWTQWRYIWWLNNRASSVTWETDV